MFDRRNTKGEKQWHQPLTARYAAPKCPWTPSPAPPAATRPTTRNKASAAQNPQNICDGEYYIIGSSVYYTDTISIDTLTAGNGCDSIVYTNVSISSIIWNQTYLICDGDSIVVGSSVYDTAGAYMDTLSSANGCDSIVYTYLVVDQNTSSYDTLSVNVSMVWNGMTLTVSGDYSIILINSAGCDSIANLNLTILPSGVQDLSENRNKTVLRIINVLGEPTKPTSNTPLFYIYDDGTVERRIVIE